jgi:hypothetical protein
MVVFFVLAQAFEAWEKGRMKKHLALINDA